MIRKNKSKNNKKRTWLHLEQPCCAKNLPFLAARCPPDPSFPSHGHLHMSECCMACSSSLPKQSWLQRYSGDRPTPRPFPPLPTLTSRHICWPLINVPVRQGQPGVAWSWRKGIPHRTAARAGQQQSTWRGNAPHAVGQAGWKGCFWGGVSPRICGRNNSFALGHQWAHPSTLEGRLLGRKPAVVLYFLPCQICPSPFLSPLWF